MSSVSEPGEFHVELPGDWPPCPTCASTTRVAVATIKHRNVGFFCGSLHRLDWEEDNGSTGYWVKHYHFWPGGQFEGLISHDFIGVPKAKNTDRRFDVNERRADWIHNEQRACAVCGVPAMRDWHDRKKLLFWLKEHHPDLFGEIMSVVNVMQPRPTLQNWFDGIAKGHQDVVGEINRRVQDSHLQVDHGVPKAVLNDLWGAWDVEMRRIATTTLAFGYCRPHNNGKHKRLPSREELLRRHIQLNHDGSEKAARASREQWDALQRVLDSIDAYRKSDGARDIIGPVAADETA